MLNNRCKVTLTIIVVCIHIRSTYAQVPGYVRLINGSKPSEGRVEVWYNDCWGTVCDDHWTLDDANVVCRQLGFPSAMQALRAASHGQGKGAIVLDDLMCSGNEYNILECPHLTPAGKHNCDHSEDASVICENDIRLTNGSSNLEGRVEVYSNNRWRKICNNRWNLVDGAVVCRQLGFGTVKGTTEFRTNRYIPIYADGFRCRGDEDRLIQCSRSSHISTNCSRSNDAGVICTNARLAGGSVINEGRVEVYYDGSWTTVCSRGWSSNDANVFCRQMGFPGAESLFYSAPFGKGSGTIKIRNLACRGSETDILQCRFSTDANAVCTHSQDAGVRCHENIRLVNGSLLSSKGRVEVYKNGHWGTVCGYFFSRTSADNVCRQWGAKSNALSWAVNGMYTQGNDMIMLYNVDCYYYVESLYYCNSNESFCTHAEDIGVSCPTVRLMGGSTNYEGRVEIFNNGDWKTVCDQLWSLNDAKVVCRQLGLGTAISAFSNGEIWKGRGINVFTNFQCTGNETDIFSCPVYGSSRTCYSASVTCTDIRLVGRRSSYSGRVEVYIGNQWYTICIYSWGFYDASAACRQLGFPFGASRALRVGGGTGPIWLNDPDCGPNSQNVITCPSRGRTTGCTHYHDAGASCIPIRLVGGNCANEGRVEVFYNGSWGTVCDDFWDEKDAAVVCNQLGFETEGLIIYSEAQFGQGTGDIILDDLQCYGSEQNIFDCPHNGGKIHNCGHSEDAGIFCPTQLPGAGVMPHPYVVQKILSCSLMVILYFQEML